MRFFPSSLSGKLLILPPLLVGVVVVAVAMNVSKPPQEATVKEKPTPARVIKVTEITVQPRIQGFGVVAPARQWTAAAPVAGPVVWLSDALRDGRLVEAGTELLRIDDTEYRLSLSQIEAQITAAGVKAKANRASLAIEQRLAGLATAELKRIKTLVDKGVQSKTRLEEAQKAAYLAESKVQDLRNALDIADAETDVLERQRGLARLNLERTAISAPFNLRLRDVKVAVGDYANRGQALFAGDSTDHAEITAQFPVGALRPLVIGDCPGCEHDTMDRPHVNGLGARVLLRSGGLDTAWEATVDRVAGAIDPQARTMGVVIAVNDPYGKRQAGRRPPLIPGMSVEVELLGKPQPGTLVMPATAVRDGKAFVFNAESKRLEIRSVSISYTMGPVAMVADGLADGDIVIVSDLPTPVDGLLIKPVKDEEAKKALIAAAQGKDGKAAE